MKILRIPKLVSNGPYSLESTPELFRKSVTYVIFNAGRGYLSTGSVTRHDETNHTEYNVYKLLNGFTASIPNYQIRVLIYLDLYKVTAKYRGQQSTELLIGVPEGSHIEGYSNDSLDENVINPILFNYKDVIGGNFSGTVQSFF